MRQEHVGFLQLCGPSKTDVSGAVATTVDSKWMWGGAALAASALVAGVVYQRSKAKEQMRQEVRQEAVELRGVRDQRPATSAEYYRDAWERTYREPFPYEFDAFGMARPEGSSEPFKEFPLYLPPSVLKDVLDQRKTVPSLDELAAWDELAQTNGASLYDVSNMARAIDDLQRKGIEDSWIPVLSTGSTVQKFRSLDHVKAFRDIVRSRRTDHAAKLAQDHQQYLEFNSSDPRWRLVKFMDRPLEKLQRLNAAMQIPVRKDMIEEKLLESPDPRRYNADWDDNEVHRVLRRLLEVDAGPYALFVAATMAGEGMGDPVANDAIKIALETDAFMQKAKVPKEEDRRRLAAAYLVKKSGEQEQYAYRDRLTGIARTIFDFEASPLAPQYPNLGIDEAARVAIGMPFDEVFRKIPKRTALKAIKQLSTVTSKMYPKPFPVYEPSVRRYYVEDECSEARRLAYDSGMEDVFDGLPRVVAERPAVAEWVASICKDTPRMKALLQKRNFPMPGGQQFQQHFINRIDEIRDEDIRSPRDSVQDVFQRAAERVSREMEKKYLKTPNVPLGRVPEWWPVSTAAELEQSGGKLQILRTARQLIREGDELQHCVGTYCPMVQTGESFIGQLTMPSGERTTLEFTRSGNLRQNFGPGNSPPSKEAIEIGKRLEQEVQKRMRERAR